MEFAKGPGWAALVFVILPCACRGKEPPNEVDRIAVVASLAAVTPVLPPPCTPPLRERPLDTDVGPKPKPGPGPSPNEKSSQKPAKAAAPSNTNRKVRTPADEDLPPWVPIRGRLTVLESSDLAENLGLVPPGTTKRSAEPITVAEVLAAEEAARAAEPKPVRREWTYIPGGAFVDHR